MSGCFVNYQLIDEVEEVGVVAVFEGLLYHVFQGNVVEVAHGFLPFLDKSRKICYNVAVL